MSLKHVCEVADVRARMSLEDIPEINDAIDAALSAAHVFFKGLLETEFEYQTCTDYFFLDSGRFPPPRDGFYKLKLRNGFVFQVQSVLMGANPTDFSQATALVFEKDYLPDPQRGIIRILTAQPMDPGTAVVWGNYLTSGMQSGSAAAGYVQVTYTSGFDSAFLNKSPDWLREAVLTYVPLVLGVQQTSHTSGLPTGTTGNAGTIAGRMIEPYLRNKGMMFKPYYSK